MSVALKIVDETLSGEKTREFTLELVSSRINARELIRSRVRQEVEEYNARQPEIYHGLVQPTETEKTLNGYRLRRRRKLDWREESEKAIEAFRRNGFLILVNDRQIESLDEEFVIDAGTKVTFIKLVPLVGG